LTGKGYSLLGVSPDREMVLVSEGSNLYALQISDGKMVRLADNLFKGTIYMPLDWEGIGIFPTRRLLIGAVQIRCFLLAGAAKENIFSLLDLMVVI
jgi:hypothetical protein